MDAAEPVADLLQRCQAGDPEAAQQLFACYAQRLARVADQHLGRKVAVREDAEDVVQSVFRTFFRRAAAGEFRVDRADQLWNLLVTITLRKTSTRGRYHTAERRDVGAEEPSDAGLLRALAKQPGPAEAAELVDLVQVLLRGLAPVYYQILDLRMQGVPVAEIAPALNLSRQSVYRALGLLGHRLKRLAQTEDEAGEKKL
jgi:RNA polymerase sigma-70 factor (ECF subfamily)